MEAKRPPRTDGRPRLRVLLLLSWLNGDGAERVAVHLTNRSDATLFDMRMGLLRRAGPCLPPVDPSRLHFRRRGERAFPPHRLARSAIVAPFVYRSIVREVRPDVVNCRFGPRELIRHDVSGLPPEDVGALAQGLDRLLGDSALRARLGAGGRERVEALRPDRALPLHARLFEEQAAPRRTSGLAGVAPAETGALLLEGAD
ncbi:MAG TPA: hypothetical protein VFW19_15650 [Allosphingosinicella sp.]|nr:hypothetical protein [Allosphingosinicella sp.]